MPRQRFLPPIKGLNKRMPVEDSEKMTTYYLMNVRAPGSLERQVRIAQRPGLDKWSTTQVSGGTANPVIAMVELGVIL